MAKPIIVEGATAKNPQTGQRIIYRKGKWYPVDQDPGGQRPSNATLEPLTPGAEARSRLALGLGPSINAQRQMYRSEQWKPENIGTGRNALGKNPYGSNFFPNADNIVPNWLARAAEAVPFDGGAAARVLGGQDYQDYEQAAKTFEAAFMPILSGAAVTESEAKRMIRANLPQLGDTPQTLAKKATNRAMMINAAADLLGRPRPFPKVGIMDLGQGSRPPAAPAKPSSGQPPPQPQEQGWELIAVE